MSEKNIELIRFVYQALNRGDWDAALAFADPNFEITFQRGPNAGTHRGRDSVGAILEDAREPFDSWIVEVEEIVESGDQVVALIKNRMHPKGTDAEIETRNGHLWTIRDGVGVSVRGFPNPDEALEAAGLSE
jgi:ketosteroid isomerase-like protein